MDPCSAAAAHTQTASNMCEHHAPDVADATDKSLSAGVDGPPVTDTT